MWIDNILNSMERKAEKQIEYRIPIMNQKKYQKNHCILLLLSSHINLFLKHHIARNHSLEETTIRYVFQLQKLNKRNEKQKNRTC